MVEGGFRRRSREMKEGRAILMLEADDEDKVRESMKIRVSLRHNEGRVVTAFEKIQEDKERLCFHGAIQQTDGFLLQLNGNIQKEAMEEEVFNNHKTKNLSIGTLPHLSGYAYTVSASA